MCPQGSLLCSQDSDHIFLLLSAWWLPGLPDSRDGGTHLSDKPPCHCSQGSQNFLLSLIPSPPPFRGTAYLVSVTLAQAKGQRGPVGLWKCLLLAKTFHDLRVANNLVARKVTVAISEVSRDSRHAQARCWRMASTCSLLPDDTCSSFCFSTPLSMVHLTCPQEGGPWGTDLWAALRYAQGFVVSCTGRWGSHADWVPEPSQPG